MKKISFCIPVYNEEENIDFAYNKIKELFKNNLLNYEYEIIFTDNHSDDQTKNIISNICKKDCSVKYLRFKNNLGYDKSILEGYKSSSGDAAIVIDCDLQDPIDLIKIFLEYWEKGYDLVYGVRVKRLENTVINLLRKFFYIIMNLQTQINYPLNAGDFRIIDKKIINDLRDDNSLYPYVRGLSFSYSKRSIGIPYTRNKRLYGKSKLGLYKSFTYAINALIEETPIFIRYFGKIAFFFTISSFFFTIWNLIHLFKYLDIFRNIILITIFLFFIFFSIMGEYVLRIYLQLKKNKTIVIEEKINFKN